MSGLWPFRKLTSGELVSVIRRRVRSQNLLSTLAALYRTRRRSELFSLRQADRVFEKVHVLGTSSPDAAEKDLLILFAPPDIHSELTQEKVLWAEVFQVLVELQSEFSEEFCSRLFRTCLATQTHMGFALCHSTVVADLAGIHPKALDPSLIEVLIAAAEDSRSIYAIKMAKCLADWSAIKTQVMSAMLSRTVVKQVEAMWLVNERGKIEEVLHFAAQNGLRISCTNSIQTITRAIVNSTSKGRNLGFRYAIHLNGFPVATREAKEISETLREDLE